MAMKPPVDWGCIITPGSVTLAFLPFG